MKTDTIFYSLFQAFPSIFFELINQSPAEATAYEFTSREVKQLAFRLDGLFLPTTNNPDKPRRLIQQTKQQVTDEAAKRDLINLIETIIVYKLPQKSREEIEAMLGLSELKNTKVYQEAFTEGKQKGLEEGKQQGLEEGKQKTQLEAIPKMIQLGLSLEAIAQVLDLPVEVVEQVAQQLQK
ncbi:hypothetical protein B4U84_13635 [Westiellopsis prolifica IICB1]|nr:hypothetical protein B4U84_13635 [Westiellopsis prolifica IICB1]